MHTATAGISTLVLAAIAGVGCSGGDEPAPLPLSTMTVVPISTPTSTPTTTSTTPPTTPPTSTPTSAASTDAATAPLEPARPLASWEQEYLVRGAIRLRLPPRWRMGDDQGFDVRDQAPGSSALPVTFDDFDLVGEAETGLTTVGVYRFTRPLTHSAIDVVAGLEQSLGDDPRIRAVDRTRIEVDGRTATRVSFAGPVQSGVIDVVVVGEEILVLQARWSTEYPETADEALGILSTFEFDETTLPTRPPPGRP